MTSDFVEVKNGFVRYDDEAWATKKEEPAVQDLIEKIGEERTRRAGSILDTGTDGYYTTAACIPDFLKVQASDNVNHSQ